MVRIRFYRLNCQNVLNFLAIFLKFHFFHFSPGVPGLGGLDLGTLLTNPAIMDMVCLFPWLHLLRQIPLKVRAIGAKINY